MLTDTSIFFFFAKPPLPPIRDGADSVNGTAQTALLWLAIWKHPQSLLLFLHSKLSYPGWYKHTKTNNQPLLPNPTIFLCTNCLYVNKTNTPNVWLTWPALTFKHAQKLCAWLLTMWCHINYYAPNLHQHHTTTATSVLAIQWKCLPLTAKCNCLMFFYCFNATPSPPLF